MTKDELQKAVDDVITDCIRNDYAFGNYAHRVTEAVWPVLEAAEKERDALRAKIERMEKMQDALRRHHEMAMGAGLDPSHSLTKLRVSAYQQTCLYADTVAALEE